MPSTPVIPFESRTARSQQSNGEAAVYETGGKQGAIPFCPVTTDLAASTERLKEKRSPSLTSVLLVDVRPYNDSKAYPCGVWIVTELCRSRRSTRPPIMSTLRRSHGKLRSNLSHISSLRRRKNLTCQHHFLPFLEWTWRGQLKRSLRGSQPSIPAMRFMSCGRGRRISRNARQVCCRRCQPARANPATSHFWM